VLLSFVVGAAAVAAAPDNLTGGGNCQDPRLILSGRVAPGFRGVVMAGGFRAYKWNAGARDTTGGGGCQVVTRRGGETIPGSARGGLWGTAHPHV